MLLVLVQGKEEVKIKFLFTGIGKILLNLAQAKKHGQRGQFVKTGKIEENIPQEEGKNRNMLLNNYRG